MLQKILVSWNQFLADCLSNLNHPVAILLLQIVTVIIVARFFGFVCRKIGQPVVIGEIVAGILLGPSFLGMYFPDFSTFLFPASSLHNLELLSQLGLVLFMFIVGMELDFRAIKIKTSHALIISHASIAIPFAMGVALGYFLYQQFAPEGISPLSFGLFIGIAISITAFPVLARIVKERNMSKTRLGMLAITCAAVDDITAWCILAALIAIEKAGSFYSSLYVVLISVAYVLFMIKVMQPFLREIGEIYFSNSSLKSHIIALFFIILFISAFSTQLLGIHPLFGAFMAGLVMPTKLNFRNIFIEKMEDTVLVLLLPLFFVFTGLRTQIGLLRDPVLLQTAGIIIMVAIAGKFLGSAVAARLVGQNLKDSLIIGALMNTRGLMELVVLNIGYDLGILNPEVFLMMVIMALVTTFMTGPALNAIDRWVPSKGQEPELGLEYLPENLLTKEVDSF